MIEKTGIRTTDPVMVMFISSILTEKRSFVKSSLVNSRIKKADKKLLFTNIKKFASVEKRSERQLLIFLFVPYYSIFQK